MLDVWGGPLTASVDLRTRDDSRGTAPDREPWAPSAMRVAPTLCIVHSHARTYGDAVARALAAFGFESYSASTVDDVVLAFEEADSPTATGIDWLSVGKRIVRCRGGGLVPSRGCLKGQGTVAFAGADLFVTMGDRPPCVNTKDSAGG
jgi:hypothetical protein